MENDSAAAPSGATGTPTPAPAHTWNPDPARARHATVAVAGGGPAGMMLALGFARRGIDVIVLEKHADFLRDFRGDTVHPSTLDIIDQLGLRERFDAIEHHSVTTLDGVIDGLRITPVDFSRLHGPNKQVALMPQWDLLDLLADAGRETGNVTVLMSTTAKALIKQDGAIRGIKARDADGDFVVTADLTVIASGRGCPLTDYAHLESRAFGVPIDVLWFRLPAPSPRPPDTLVYLSPDVTVLTIPRTDYFQCGRLIEKDGFAGLKMRGLPAFRDDLVEAAPVLKDVVGDLTDWDQVKLLSVRVDRLTQWWQPGLLAIGDAA
ncbi:MAG TPA: FAD-dependent monooxygenase, partial [Pseudolysinimonas sp.]|nr:FAD-dependent monooxygenase [Pseudolysinimonas sp.]